MTDWRTPTPRWHRGFAGSQIEWADACKLVEGPWDTRSSTTSGQGGADLIPTRLLALTKHHMSFMGLIVSLLERIGESTAWTQTSIWWSLCQDASWKCYTKPASWAIFCINASISVFPLGISIIVCTVCVLSLFRRKRAAHLWTYALSMAVDVVKVECW